ncbi:MAG: hypothetical protein HKN45_05420 [Flavobacteriales bacterium]|nr:hypothetical protein [Flavobacteriales bacterium]
MKVSLFLLLFVLSAKSLWAQDDPSIIIHDVNILYGGYGNHDNDISSAELLNLAPGAIDLLLEDTNSPYNYFNSFNGAYSFGAGIGLRFTSREFESLRSNPTLRLGLTYHNGSLLSYGESNTTTVRIDTLVSNQTGEEIYVDSVNTSILDAEYKTEQLRIDAAIIYRTSEEKKLTLFGGLGLTAGMTFNNQTEVYRSERSEIEDGNNLSTNFLFEVEKRIYTNETSFALSAYLPFGTEYRISKSHPMWSKMHLKFEMRPSLTFVDIPEYDSLTLSEFHGLFGIRYEVSSSQ